MTSGSAFVFGAGVLVQAVLAQAVLALFFWVLASWTMCFGGGVLGHYE